MALEGTSFRSSFYDVRAPSKDTQYYVMLGTRGIWHKGWKANTVHASAPSDWSHFVADKWELFNTEEDREGRPGTSTSTTRTPLRSRRRSP